MKLDVTEKVRAWRKPEESHAGRFQIAQREGVRENF